MKLISCYVKGFGTLKDFSLNFEDGLNTVLCDNGAGKTTLLSFIKAMLFGLEYKKTGGKFYERINYCPWDGGEWGGSLVVEHNDKRYRIERNFAKKQSEDSFALFDEDSMRECDDYGEDFGERILGVDKASFEKSLFFGQGALETGITASLNAKMGNVSDIRDDMNRFDEAIKTIDNARKEYEKKTAKGWGKIPLLDEEIKESKKALEQIPVLENAVRERKRSIEEKSARIDVLLGEKNVLAEKIKSAGQKKETEGAINAKREHQARLKEELGSLEGFFGGNIPDEETVDKMQSLQRDVVERASRISEIQGHIPDEDRREFLTEIFGAEGAVTQETIDTSVSLAGEVSKLRVSGEATGLSKENEEALENMREFFSQKLPTTEEITECRQLSEKITENETQIKLLIERVEEDQDRLNAIKTKGVSHHVILLSFGILLIITGLFIGLFAEGKMANLGFTACLVLGAIMTIVPLIFYLQDRISRKKDINLINSKNAELNEKIQKSLGDVAYSRQMCTRFLKHFMEVDNETQIMESLVEVQRKLDEYNRLMRLFEETKKDTAQNTDALAELTMDLYTRLDFVAKRYGYDLYKDNKETELLSRISEDLKEYDTLLENLSQVKSITDEMESIEDELNHFMERFEFPDEKTAEQKLSHIKACLQNYRSLKKQINELEEEIPSKDEEKNEEELSLEKLQEESLRLDEKYEPLVSDRAREEEELKRLVSDIEMMEEQSRSLPALKEKRAELADRVSVLNDTKKYLEQAREDFLSVYMKPLRDSMSKYVDAFIPKDQMEEMEISLDMDLNIKLLRRGNVLSGDYLSEGYKDTALLCARLALIDVLYKGEKPPFFMDDPFTNLDKNKIQKALELLEKIAKDIQIIYLTCHDSRSTGKTISINRQ